MKKLIILITLTIFNISKSQEYPPPTDLITIPTAGTLMRGSYSMDMRIQDAGGLILGLRTGITDRFQFGLSFGSPNLIGDDSLIWYPRPEANLKYLIIDCLWYNFHPSHFNLEKSLYFIKKFKPKKAILTNLSPVLDYKKLKNKLPNNVIPAHDGLTLTL